jgi:hypothetical protein
MVITNATAAVAPWMVSKRRSAWAYSGPAPKAPVAADYFISTVSGAREYHTRRRKGYERHALDHCSCVNRGHFLAARQLASGCRAHRTAIHRSLSSRWSPTRSALAIAVNDGFTAPILGKKLVSTTYRLSSSCALQLTSRTEVFRSVPKRQVPAW